MSGNGGKVVEVIGISSLLVLVVSIAISSSDKVGILSSIGGFNLLKQLNVIMASTTTISKPKFLLIGDSLTQTSFAGWGGGLAHRYQRRCDVLNRGMSGYNTRWYLKYAETSGIWKEISPSSSVKLITIFFGANDASLAKENPHAHVPLDEYASNLKSLLELSQKHYPNSKVLFITPPPVHHEQRLEFQKQRYKDKATGILERTLENTGKYADICKNIAKESRTPYLDLYNLMMKKSDGSDDDFGRYFYDGLHFNKEGHDFVLEQLLKAIEVNFPSLYVKPDPITGQENNSGSKCDGIQSSGPYHDEIHHASWENAFSDDPPPAKRSKTEE